MKLSVSVVLTVLVLCPFLALLPIRKYTDAVNLPNY